MKVHYLEKILTPPRLSEQKVEATKGDIKPGKLPKLVVRPNSVPAKSGAISI